ncbi:unnamed protein product [Heterotrigona itama]|uniref:Uncharacterized protein n=1 Tax=Heterotrigona itama TaxID=395501 RepID=A0A6V7H663_9HYME|nr:unnamed protein product [Heterotrigona itama]
MGGGECVVGERTCMGLLWLSTLSIPSTDCWGPPRRAVSTLNPTDSKFAQGLAGAPSSISFLLGPVAPPVCPNSICISILSMFDHENPENISDWIYLNLIGADVVQIIEGDLLHGVWFLRKFPLVPDLLLELLRILRMLWQ